MDSQLKFHEFPEIGGFPRKTRLCKFYHEYRPRKRKIGDFRSNTWFLSIKRDFANFTAKCGVFGQKVWFCAINWNFPDFLPKLAKFPDFSLTLSGCSKFPDFSLIVSKIYQSLISNRGFATPISWVFRNRRFSEKNSIMQMCKRKIGDFRSNTWFF